MTDKQIKNRKYYREHRDQILARKRKQYREKIIKKYKEIIGDEK